MAVVYSVTPLVGWDLKRGGGPSDIEMHVLRRVQSTVVPEFLLETLEKVTLHPAGGAVISIGVPTYREARA